MSFPNASRVTFLLLDAISRNAVKKCCQQNVRPLFFLHYLLQQTVSFHLHNIGLSLGTMTDVDRSVSHSCLDRQNIKLPQRPWTFLQLNQLPQRSEWILRSTVAGRSMVIAISYMAVVVVAVVVVKVVVVVDQQKQL